MTAPNNIVPFQTRDGRKLTVLTVEDDRLVAAFMEEQIRDLGYTVLQASNGRDALDLLAARRGQVDVVLMDRLMPVMDGLQAVRLMKDDPALRSIPVVMVSGASTSRDIQEGIEAGVFYYLGKPVDENVLKSVLLAASREAMQARVLADEMTTERVSFELIHTAKFEFRTVREAQCLAAFAAKCFPDPARVVNGLAELMVNAVEHGTLGIGYDLKTRLLDEGNFQAEIERRQGMDEYKAKPVEAIITRKDGGVYAIITDQGRGFDWKRYLTIDPARAGDNHGRGIAQARAVSFDKLVYNAEGTQAIAFVTAQSTLEW